MIKEETLLKAKILTSGVIFSSEALQYAKKYGAKGQNLVYNAPLCFEKYRPQELLLKNVDGYETVVSCVSPCSKTPVLIDVKEERLVARVDNNEIDNISIEFVKEPNYYTKKILGGHYVKDYVSACGYDELNILPWSGCAISKGCLFCGSNTIADMNLIKGLNAFSISKNNAWEDCKGDYLENLKQAIAIATESECYMEHMHVIIISGDLSDDKLNYQTEIYAEIAHTIKPYIKDKASEGIVAVLMPPEDKKLLHKLYDSGVDKVVFNIEVANELLFNKYCPGKRNIGYKHIINSLYSSVEIFGKGNVWTNFVLGLEPINELLKFNESLSEAGIVSSANVLHIDKGNRLDCTVPTYDAVIEYFYELSQILLRYNQTPFYCSKALRTSLSNEAFEGRIML